jgi:hypothetical protein
MNNPDIMLQNTKCNRKQFYEIFYHLKLLKYSEKPDYSLIRSNLSELHNFEIMRFKLSNENSLLSYMTNPFLPQNHFPLNNYIDIFQPQFKDSTRISSGCGNQTLRCNLFKENFSNIMLKEKVDLLQKKRERPLDNIENPKGRTKDNKKGKEDSRGSHLSSPISFTNQVVSKELRFAEYLNLMTVYNNTIWKNLEIEFIQKSICVLKLVNTIMNLMQSLNGCGSLSLGQSIPLNQLLQIQQQSGIYNNILAFHV